MEKKKKELKERLAAFAESLSPEEAREQLVLAFLHMERCRQVLRGEDAVPVVMKHNGEDTALELFYQCRKVREELDWLDGGEDEDEDIVYHIDLNTEKLEQGLKRARKLIREFAEDVSEVMESLEEEYE
jgi:hypothetical protein